METPPIDPQSGLKTVGYWKTEKRDYINRQTEEQYQKARHDEVANAIVPGWNDTAEAKAVIAFMKAGDVVHRWRGWASDRLDGEILGTQCWGHGGWQYPQLWWRYIEKHSVKPDNQDFIEDCCRWYVNNLDSI